MSHATWIACTVGIAWAAASSSLAQQPGDQPLPARQVSPARGVSGGGVRSAAPGSGSNPLSTPVGVSAPGANQPAHQTPIIRTPPPSDMRGVPGPADGLRPPPAITFVPMSPNQPGYSHWSPFTWNNGWGIPARDSHTGQIRGYYTGDDWRLAFHVGAGFPLVNYRYDHSQFKYPPHLYRTYYWPWADYGSTTNYGLYDPYLIVTNGTSYVASPDLMAPPAAAAPSQQSPAAAPRELTALELAELAFRAGDAAECAKQLRRHLKDYPDDAGVERLLAIALLDDHKVDQAVAIFVHAYTKQPQLARDPLDWRALGASELDHHSRFNLVMAYANRTRTSGALFAAAVLAQSEGRMDVARTLSQRAVAAGLDKHVADEMTLALVNR